MQSTVLPGADRVSQQCGPTLAVDRDDLRAIRLNGQIGAGARVAGDMEGEERP